MIRIPSGAAPASVTKDGAPTGCTTLGDGRVRLTGALNSGAGSTTVLKVFFADAPSVSASSVKTKADATAAYLSGVVARVHSDRFNVESPNRFAGVRDLLARDELARKRTPFAVPEYGTWDSKDLDRWVGEANNSRCHIRFPPARPALQDGLRARALQHREPVLFPLRTEDLLAIERPGRMITIINDNGADWKEAAFQTSFGPGVELRDITGQSDLRVTTGTGADAGKVKVWLPQAS